MIYSSIIWSRSIPSKYYIEYAAERVRQPLAEAAYATLAIVSTVTDHFKNPSLKFETSYLYNKYEVLSQHK